MILTVTVSVMLVTYAIEPINDIDDGLWRYFNEVNNCPGFWQSWAGWIWDVDGIGDAWNGIDDQNNIISGVVK